MVAKGLLLWMMEGMAIGGVDKDKEYEEFSP